jgi:hypothetical protein
MDELNRFDKLAQRARTEDVSVFDVGRQVTARILQEETAPVSFAAFDLFAGISSIAAVITLAIGISAWMDITDPLTGFLAPLQEIPLW